MQLQGTIEVLMDSTNQQSGKVDGAVIKLNNFDNWIKTSSYKSAVEKAGIKKGDEVILEAQEHTAKSGKNYYTFDVADVRVSNSNTSVPAAPAAKRKTTGYTPKKSGTYNPDGARIGCAYNNACIDAREVKKDGDTNFIIERAAFHYQNLAALEAHLQNKPVEQNFKVEEDSLEDSLDAVFGTPA